MKPVIKESKRSEEVREQLRGKGFRTYWDVREDLNRISYWTNGMGKALLLVETAHDLTWNGWDIYVQLTSENNIAKTYAALEAWTEKAGVGA